MRKVPYIIVAPPYQNSSAGIRVLYELQSHLTKKNYEATIHKDGEHPQDSIVIYPEIYHGNPLNGKTVVRYVLNYPGLLGGDKEYNPEEIIFTYHQKYFPGAPVLTVPVIEDFFIDKGQPRAGGCFWIGKGSNIPRIPETDGLTEITHSWPADRRELANLLNEKEIFYSYDDCTMLTSEAARCGCEVVVISGEKQEEPYDDLIKDFDSQLDNFIRITQQIAGLNQAMMERDGHITVLNKAIAERDPYIRRLVSSKSWIITKPMRWVSRVVSGDFVAALDPVKRALRLNSSVGLSLITADFPAPQSGDHFITASPIKPTQPVAVILPVYRGVEMTKRCILSAMPNILAIPGSRIIAINDASPDMGMQEMLEQIAAQWPNVFVVIKNEKNIGFAGTVNRGFEYFSQYDAVLLNSDAVVPQDWLTRLINEAYSKANIGTVTPFSNNATICSFPHFLQENVPPFSLDVDSIDAVFRYEKLPCIESPTGVGFCMYIRRACLDKIGYLNEEKFSRGYGEENDLCQRALKNGWLNIISPNIYVYHEGGVSFSSDKQPLIDQAMCVLDNLHPNYHTDIQLFIKRDPAKSLRIARYIQLLSTIPIPKVLHVSHALGGGVAQHVDELSQYFCQSMAHILLAPYGEDGSVSISFFVGHCTSSCADELIFAIPSDYSDLVSLLKAVGVSAVHFHHTHGLDSIILNLPTDLGVAHLLTVHDYYWLNANPTLTDKTGKYSGFYSNTQRNPLYPLPKGMNPEKWQKQFHPLMETASYVIFPSNATKTIFDNVYHPDNAVVAPHIETQLAIDRKPRIFTKKSCYTIGVLGAISPEKGANLLENIAKKAKNLDLPFKFKLIGYAYRSLKFVETTGPYKVQDLENLIQKHELDIIFFPAQWPETYSYTLSHALNSGLPIIAPNIGAFPERLSGRQNVLLFHHLRPEDELLDQINAFIEKLSKRILIKAPIFKGDKSKHDFYVGDYIPIVARDLKVLKAKETMPLELRSMKIISGSDDKNTLWRKKLLRILWPLYMNPSIRWINQVIPYAVRRCIKRFLSRGTIHNIINYK